MSPPANPRTYEEWLALNDEQRDAIRANWNAYEREGIGFAYTAAGRLAISSVVPVLDVKVGTYHCGEYTLMAYVADAALPGLPRMHEQTFEGFRVQWLPVSLLFEVWIRHFRLGDHIAIAEIFPAAVHEVASRDYTPEQCLAWSDREPNYEHWEKRCQKKQPFVAEVNSEIAGFLELDPDGHIDCAYINPKFQRRGVMSQLVLHAINVCRSRGIHRVYVEASICAKPMFEKLEFKVLEENVVTIKGVDLLNFRMERMVDGDAG